ERRKKTVDRQDGHCGRGRVHTKHSEYAGQEIRVHRHNPCGGPGGSGSGEAKPSPEAMELATLAISEGSVKSARVIGFFSPYIRPITARRMASATITIIRGERKMRRSSGRETILPPIQPRRVAAPAADRKYSAAR